MKDTITLSPKALSLAQSRADADGFSSVDAYVEALIQEDQAQVVVQDRISQRVEEGLASPSAGAFTKDKLKRLVSEGIERSSRRE